MATLEELQTAYKTRSDELLNQHINHQIEDAYFEAENIKNWRQYCVSKFMITHEMTDAMDLINELRGYYLAQEKAYKSGNITLTTFINRAKTAWGKFRTELARYGFVKAELTNVSTYWSQFQALETKYKNNQLTYPELCAQTEIVFMAAVRDYLEII